MPEEKKLSKSLQCLFSNYITQMVRGSWNYSFLSESTCWECKIKKQAYRVCEK
jgi:hypothetical protein